MNCPECEKEMFRIGAPYCHENGDKYTYEMCSRCGKQYEIIEDILYGEEPYINREV